VVVKTGVGKALVLQDTEFTEFDPVVVDGVVDHAAAGDPLSTGFLASRIKGPYYCTVGAAAFVLGHQSHTTPRRTGNRSLTEFGRAETQQIRGRCSPAIQSTMQVPPKPVFMRTKQRSSSSTRPTIAASLPLGYSGTHHGISYQGLAAHRIGSVRDQSVDCSAQCFAYADSAGSKVVQAGWAGCSFSR